jgi:hypothetical protein
MSDVRPKPRELRCDRLDATGGVRRAACGVRRAANYRSVGQIYLLDNLFLRVPLTPQL